MCHILRRGEKEPCVRAALPVRAIESGAVANRDEHILQAMAILDVVMDIAGGDVSDANTPGQRDKLVDAWGVAKHVVLLQLHHDIVCAEPIDIGAKLRLGFGAVSGVNELSQPPMTAA